MTAINVKDSPAMTYFTTMKGQYDPMLSQLAMVWGLGDQYWHSDWCYAPSQLIFKEMLREAAEEKEKKKKQRPECAACEEFGEFKFFRRKAELPPTEDQMFLASKQLSAILGWRMDKNIYAIDKTIAAMLAAQCETEFDKSITTDMITLPHMCIYVKLPHRPPYDGMFVYFNDHFQENIKELVLIPITKEGTFAGRLINMFIPREPTAIDKAIEDYAVASQKAGMRDYPDVPKHEIREIYKNLRYWLRYIINVILYLKSDNAELRQVNRTGYVPWQPGLDSYVQIMAIAAGEKTGLLLRQKMEECRKAGTQYVRPVSHFEAFADTDKTSRIKWISGIEE